MERIKKIFSGKGKREANPVAQPDPAPLNSGSLASMAGRRKRDILPGPKAHFGKKRRETAGDLDDILKKRDEYNNKLTKLFKS